MCAVINNFAKILCIFHQNFEVTSQLDNCIQCLHDISVLAVPRDFLVFSVSSLVTNDYVTAAVSVIATFYQVFKLLFLAENLCLEKD